MKSILSSKKFIKPLIFALIFVIILLLNICSPINKEPESYENSKVTMVDVSIGMRGDNYFCVYDKSWKIDGWSHPFYREGTKSTPSDPIKDKSCTVRPPFKGFPDQANIAPYYTHYGSGVIIGKRNFKKLEVTFKRFIDGPIIKMEFDLVGKLSPDWPWQYGTIYPVITETGVKLFRKDLKRGKELVDTRYREIFIEFKKDGE